VILAALTLEASMMGGRPVTMLKYQADQAPYLNDFFAAANCQ
jgi:hypothetical protein